MQGSKRAEEPAFHYFQMHKLIPDGHILKLVDKHVDFSFVKERVSHLYSEKGRPSIDPVLIETTKKQMGTTAYRISQKNRKRIEALFDEAKEQMGLRGMKFRGRGTVSEQAWLTATVQNIKRLVKHLERLVPKPASAARAIGNQSRCDTNTAQKTLFLPRFKNFPLIIRNWQL